jgi:hypothetical protein
VEDSLALPVLLLVLACCETASPERKNKRAVSSANFRFMGQKYQYLTNYIKLQK